MKPIIGITTYGRFEKKFDTFPFNTLFTVPDNYVNAVRRAGGIPILLPPGQEDWEDWEQLLGSVDGIILTGGTDVNPANYDGDTTHPKLGRGDDERDASELAVARIVTEQQIPTLCICRGIQLANVALGGSIYEHLPDVPDKDSHQNDAWLYHKISIAPSSKLADALGATRIAPPAGHHQGIKELAPGMTPTGWADDGLIEAFENPDHPWFVGVQWHPEKAAADDPTQQRLFDTLVKAAAAHANLARE